MIERKIKPKLKIVFSLSPRAHHVNEGKHTYIDIESSAAVPTGTLWSDTAVAAG